MSRARSFLALSAVLVCVALTSSSLIGAPSDTVVISQVYGGGGNAGATLRNDFIELFNRGTTSVSLNGWSVQYASTAGTTWAVTNLTNVSLAPGQYYLVQEAAGTGGTVNLPTPDATGSIAMSANNGKVALVSSTTALSGSCPTGGSIVDFVGFGTANCFEGAAATAGLIATTAALRGGNGCTDTDNNGADFTIGAPVAHNTLSTPSPCSSPSTPPTATSATANPSLAFRGLPVLFVVTVRPGTNPVSTNVTVTGDFSSIDATAAFTQTGVNAVTGELTFIAQAPVGPHARQGGKNLPLTISDAEGRQTTSAIAMAVRSPSTTRINEIQGSGIASPLAGQDVTTEGIVTGVRSNGFFIQDMPSNYDGDPNTSEGVFVFTSSTPPATAAVGNFVLVIGDVQEFVPTADPFQRPTTEVINPFVALQFTGLPMPAAVPLTSADLNPDVSVDQLERLEGMRVSVAEMTVVAPTGGTVNEGNATSSSNGVFYGVLPGTARPFREPGIEVFEPVPADALDPSGVPRFDANPERIRVDSDAIGGLRLDVTPGATVTNLIGPLDYAFRSYTIDPEPASTPLASGVLTGATPDRAPATDEFTVASANVERFFDTVDDPSKQDAVLTTTAFANRLNKISLQIRAIMQSPDIIGLEEVENLFTLQAIANKVNNDAVAAGDPNPGYVAYLEEGNDIGGIDSGFLVKSARVDVVDVTQEGLATQFQQPDLTLATLNDRPPLILRARIHHTTGDAGVAVTVIVNHLRSLSGVNDAMDGPRVRAKRRAQAEYLAGLIQTRQSADPNERIISVGDYNAFQFSDGYVDSIGTIKGTPASPLVVTLASPDLVTPDLVDLVDTAPADQRYSFIFDGNAQELDHVLVTPNVAALSHGLSYGRSNTDFPESFRNDPNSPIRVSDHDPVVAYFSFAMPTETSLSATPPTSTFGDAVTFTATVTAAGSPVSAGAVTFGIDGSPAGGPVAVDATGLASFTTSSLSAGSHTITANYGGAGTLQPSDATLTMVVNSGPTITSIVSSSNPSNVGDPVTFTATVTTSAAAGVAGSVVFSDGGTPLATVPLDASGHAALTTSGLSAGSHTVSADFSGDNFLASHASVTQHVLLSISIGDVDVKEPDKKLPAPGAAVFTVLLSAPSSDAISVHFATANGTALAGSDYTATSGTLVIPPGAISGIITVDVLAHPRHESTETFTVKLSDATNATIDDGEAIGRIVDFSPHDRRDDEKSNSKSR